MGRPDDIFQQKEYSSGKQVYIFLLCFFVAALIWFFSQHVGSEVQQHTFKVKYINIPEHLLLHYASDSVIQVDVAGITNVLSLLYKQNNYIEVDLSKALLQKKGRYYECVIHTHDLHKLVQKALRSNVQISSTYPHLVLLRFSEYAHKKVPVHYRLKYSLKKQFAISGPVAYLTDSVLIEGDKDRVEKINMVYTNLLEITEADRNMQLDFTIDTTGFGGLVYVVNEQVSAIIKIENYTELTFSLPLASVVDGKKYKFFPSIIDIAVDVPLSKASSIKASDFAVVVVPTETAKQMFPVKLIKKHAFATVKLIEPAEVEYLILAQ